jgi:hypothetical protein
MDLYSFRDKMYDLCYKNKQKRPSMRDIRYFYYKYDITYKLINGEDDARSMLRFTSFSTKQKLIYRKTLHEMGIELTPDQVDYYINMICLIVKEKYGIDV